MADLTPWNQTVLYNIYPWSFKEDEGHKPQSGHGTIKGMIEKIPYLGDLGITAVWVSPPYPGPLVDTGYDTTNITAIHPDLGTLKEFDEFINKCHDSGIRVMMDFIPNHTSTQHEWFQKSRDKETGFEDWYIWHPGKIDDKGNRVPPNNWASDFSQPNRKARDRGEMPWLKEEDWTPPISAWEWDDSRGEFYLHHFLKEQADLNWSKAEVREAMKQCMRFWLDRGADGFRMDAVNHMAKNMEFLDEEINTAYNEKEFDNPYDQLLRFNSSNNPEPLRFYVQEMCSVAREAKYEGRDVHLLLEAYMGESELRELNAVDPEYATAFNFGPFHMEWSALKRKVQLDYYYQNFNEKGVPNQIYGNHDNSRLATRFGDKNARAIAVLALFTPGMGIIYSSEELGMHDGAVPSEKMHDPAEFRDPFRTPIVWNDALPNAGFSNASAEQLWLPINESDLGISATRQLNDAKSFYWLYKESIRLRRELPAIRDGRYVKINTDNEEIVAFGRTSGDEHAIILINFSPYIQHTNLLGNEFAAGRSVLSSIDVRKNIQEGLNLEEGVHLQPNEALVIVPTVSMASLTRLAEQIK